MRFIMTRKLTILTFKFLIICFNATAQLTNEETNQIRQILIEESNDKWIIGILIGGIAIGVAILTTLVLVIYHNTRDVANKASDVRDMKKDIEIAMSKQLEKWDVIQSTVSNELEEMKKISNSVKEDKDFLVGVKDEVDKEFTEIRKGFKKSAINAEMILQLIETIINVTDDVQIDIEEWRKAIRKRVTQSIEES